MSLTSKSEMRAHTDWHLTSTGVGHNYRSRYYFPSSKFQSVMNEPLPSELARQDEITNDQRYDTTTGTIHDYKYMGGIYGNDMYRKGPGIRRINYIKDHVEKLGPGGWRQPLTMGNQSSETRSQFCSASGIRQEHFFDDIFGHQTFNLNDHHKEGPSKYGQASTQNPKLQGLPWYVKDKGVLKLLDPYLSTTQKEHRYFPAQEQRGYPRKNVATYWECEEYPKAWGHGGKHNPVPKETVPRERLPMRDPTWFKTATKVPRPPKALVPVPHSGLKSEHQDMYQRPSDIKMKYNRYMPVDTPFVLPDPGSKSVMTAPKMYMTEYENVGSGKPITV